MPGTASVRSSRQSTSVEDPHSLPNWAPSLLLRATDVWPKNKAVGTQTVPESSKERAHHLLAALAVVCSQLRTKLLSPPFHQLGEGESGLRLGLNRQSFQREKKGEVF